MIQLCGLLDLFGLAMLAHFGGYIWLIPEHVFYEYLKGVVYIVW